MSEEKLAGVVVRDSKIFTQRDLPSLERTKENSCALLGKDEGNQCTP